MRNYFLSFWLVCAVANANMFDKMQIKDFIDFQIFNVMFSWQCWASYNTNLQINVNAKRWICDDKYANSISVEIANALGFCLNSNNFSKQFENKIACKVVKICDKQMLKFVADPTGYTRANWNAVVLYNYIFLTMYDKQCCKTDNTFCYNIKRYMTENMTKVADTIFEGYKNSFLDKDKLKNSIDCATRDITEYIEKTNLHGFINSLKKNWQYLDMYGNNMNMDTKLRYLCYGTNQLFYFNQKTHSGRFVVLCAVAEVEGKKIPCNIEVIVRNGKVSEYKLYDTSGYTSLFNEIARFRTLKDNFKMDKDFIEQLWQEKLLSLDKVHNLVNNTLVGKDSPYVTYKCYLNSVLQALHASHAVREKVERLPHISRCKSMYKLKDISPIMSEYFKLIETSGTKDAKKKQYQQNTKDLADILEYTNAYKKTFDYVGVVTDNDRIQKLNDLYERKCLDLPSDLIDCTEEADGIYVTNYNKNGHMLRDGRKSHKATNILGELMYALNTEALEKNEEELTTGRVVWMNIDDNKGGKSSKVELESVYDEGYTLSGDFTFRQNGNNIKYDQIISKSTKYDLQVKGRVPFCSNKDTPSVEKDAERFHYLHMLYMVSLEPYEDKNGNIIQSSFKTKIHDEITRSVGNGVDYKEYKYRLVSMVDYAGTGGHFVAKLLTKEGWIECNDTSYSDFNKLGEFEEVTPNDKVNSLWNKNHNILIYERVY